MMHGQRNVKLELSRHIFKK